jgi:hypothetical protein
LAQKDEQLKREAALEAQRAADKKEKDEEAAKAAAAAQAAAEKAKYMLDAAKAAREEAEKKAAAEAEEIKKAHEKVAEETKKAHEKAIAEAKAAAEALEKAKKAAEEEAAKLKPSDAPKAPIKFKDAVGRKFSFPWHLCKSWKVRTSIIPLVIQSLTAPRAWKNLSNRPFSTSMSSVHTFTKGTTTSLVLMAKSFSHKSGRQWFNPIGPSPCTCGLCLNLLQPHQSPSLSITILDTHHHRMRSNSYLSTCQSASQRA